MSDIPYSQKWQDEQALFRFQTISPLLDTELDAKKKNTLRQQIAQDLLDKETLEEFRFLLNFEFDSTSPMALILVGQTELWVEKLRLQRYAAIRQCIDVNCVIPHLDRAETERYVRSHLEYAEGPTEIFTMKALDVIAKESAGIPRVINRICEKSLMYAFQLQRKLVDDYMVNFVLEHEIAH